MSVSNYFNKNNFSNTGSLTAESRLLLLIATDGEFPFFPVYSIASKAAAELTGLGYDNLQRAAGRLQEAGILKKVSHVLIFSGTYFSSYFEKAYDELSGDAFLNRLLQIGPVEIPKEAWETIVERLPVIKNRKGLYDEINKGCRDFLGNSRSFEDHSFAVELAEHLSDIYAGLSVEYSGDTDTQVLYGAAGIEAFVLKTVASSLADNEKMMKSIAAACSQGVISALPNILGLTPAVNTQENQSHGKHVFAPLQEANVFPVHAESNYCGDDGVTVVEKTLADLTASQAQPAASIAKTRSRKPRAKKPEDAESKQKKQAARDVWEWYSDAYEKRYGVPPVRNAKSNSLISSLVDRLGYEESKYVAAWYVGIDNRFYIARGHDLTILLSNAEALRTSWITGSKSTDKVAREKDAGQAWEQALAASDNVDMTPEEWLVAETGWRLAHNEPLTNIFDDIPKSCFRNERFIKEQEKRVEDHQEQLTRFENIVKDVVYKKTGEIFSFENIVYNDDVETISTFKRGKLLAHTVAGKSEDGE